MKGYLSPISLGPAFAALAVGLMVVGGYPILAAGTVLVTYLVWRDLSTGRDIGGSIAVSGRIVEWTPATAEDTRVVTVGDRTYVTGADIDPERLGKLEGDARDSYVRVSLSRAGRTPGLKLVPGSGRTLTPSELSLLDGTENRWMAPAGNLETAVQGDSIPLSAVQKGSGALLMYKLYNPYPGSPLPADMDAASVPGTAQVPVKNPQGRLVGQEIIWVKML
jgi:hypothetical protein